MRTALLSAAVLSLTATGVGVLNPGVASARDHGVELAMESGGPQGRSRSLAPSDAVEAQRAPHGYAALAPPAGIDVRPMALDRAVLGHNFSAARSFGIGPYAGPSGWRYRRFAYGDFLPSSLFASRYWLADFWLFGLDVPPVGYQWVRYGNDVLLVNTESGQIAQAIYAIFG